MGLVPWLNHGQELEELESPKSGPSKFVKKSFYLRKNKKNEFTFWYYSISDLFEKIFFHCSKKYMVKNISKENMLILCDLKLFMQVKTWNLPSRSLISKSILMINRVSPFLAAEGQVAIILRRIKGCDIV